MIQTNWKMPGNLLSDSLAAMRPHGVRGNEGLALWFGKEDGVHSVITHVIDVYGQGFRTSPLHMALSIRAMSVLTDLAEKLDTFLVGQIHSHPERLLDLSKLDKEHGIRIPNYLSVVCPYYAQRDLNSFEECGVHVFEDKGYRRMAPREVSNRLVWIDAQSTRIRCEVPA
jgi:proteasome lid subunit RPN8/RPN11